MPDDADSQEPQERQLPYVKRPPGPRVPTDLTFTYGVRAKNRSVEAGWDRLVVSHEGGIRTCFDHVATNPKGRPIDPERCHKLRPTKKLGYRDLWQYEVGGGARVWYSVDDDRHIVIIEEVHAGHPNRT